MRHHVVAPAVLVAAATLFACGSPGQPPLATAAGAPDSPSDPTGAPSVDAGTTTATTGDDPEAAHVIMTTTVPSGVACIVATVTGSTGETVATTVTAGGTATINFGTLTPGLITVNANAYGTACPAAGTPTWVGDPEQVTVVAGETTSIPLVLHPTSSGTGTVTFSTPAVTIAVGLTTSYAILSDGTVRAWGNTANGEFGTGVVGSTSSTPVTVTGVTNAAQIAAGTDYACVIRGDKTVICWGDPGLAFPLEINFTGYTSATLPAAVGPTVQSGLYASALSAGLDGVSFVGSGGTVGVMAPGGIAWLSATSPAIAVTPSTAAWGTGVTFLLSEDGMVVNTNSAATLFGPATELYEGQAGVVSFECAVLVNGSVECWGDDTYQELGTNGPTTTPQSAMVEANWTSGGGPVASMALSRSTGTSAFSCAVYQSGAVGCSGSGASGQLGNGQGAAISGVTMVTGLTNVVQVAAGANHACALRADGSVACWGNNDYGQLGDGTKVTRFTPVTVGAW